MVEHDIAIAIQRFREVVWNRRREEPDEELCLAWEEVDCHLKDAELLIEHGLMDPDEVEPFLKTVPSLIRKYSEAMRSDTPARKQRGKALRRLCIALYSFHDLAERAGFPKSEFRTGQRVVLIADFSGDGWDASSKGALEVHIGSPCVILAVSDPRRWEYGIPTYAVTFQDGTLGHVSELELRGE